MYRVDKRSIPRDSEKMEIRLFMNVRNESLRLPFFLKHYRRLGVDRFFIVDNVSNDGTIDTLLKEPDVHIWSTQQSYADAHYGIDWMQYLIWRYGKQRWCLVVDADELLLYPGWLNMTLQQWCKQHQNAGFDCVRMFLLDAYLNNTPADKKQIYDRLLQLDWFYDADPSLYALNINNHVVGGMRRRMFGVDACLIKHPLFLCNSHTVLHEGMHMHCGQRPSDVKGVLLHTKFLDDFACRVTEEVRRKEHWDGAKEYKKYATHCVERPSFWHSESTLFTSPQDVLNREFVT